MARLSPNEILQNPKLVLDTSIESPWNLQVSCEEIQNIARYLRLPSKNTETIETIS